MGMVRFKKYANQYFLPVNEDGYTLVSMAVEGDYYPAADYEALERKLDLCWSEFRKMKAAYDSEIVQHKAKLAALVVASRAALELIEALLGDGMTQESEPYEVSNLKAAIAAAEGKEEK